MGNSILGLRTVVYKVRELAKAKEWFANVFQTPAYFDQPFYVGFNVSGYELGLQPDVDTAESSKTDNGVVYWGVDDIEKEYKRFVELGAKELVPPTNVGGKIMTATVVDPWGNIVGLVYNPDFKL